MNQLVLVRSSRQTKNQTKKNAKVKDSRVFLNILPFPGRETTLQKKDLESFYLVLELRDTENRKQIGNAIRNEADTDDGRKRKGGEAQIPKAQDAENDTDDTQEEQKPPGREADLLVVKTLNGNHDALEDNPHGEDDGERCGQHIGSDQENDAQDHQQQAGQHPGSAIGKESLRAERENQSGETDEKGYAANHP